MALTFTAASVRSGQGIALRQAPDHAAGSMPKIALDEIECVSDPEAGNGRVHRQ